MDNAARHPQGRDRSASVARHGIAVAERKTGVSQYLLRAWERRYGAVRPTRDASGQRLYSDADIERIRLIQAVCAGGRRIGQVAALRNDELEALMRSDGSDSAPPFPRATGKSRIASASPHLDACMDAVMAFSTESVHRLLMRAAVELGPRRFIDHVAVPLLRNVGVAWADGSLRPVQEHAVSVGMRRVLGWLMEALPLRNDTPLIAFSTPAHHRHEFGAMMAAVVAAAHDCRILYLGCDLPGDEIAHGAVIAGADVVAVSALPPSDSAMLRRDLQVLRDALPETIPIVIGGAAVASGTSKFAHAGVTIVRDLDEWDSWLQRSLRELAQSVPI